MRLAIMATVAAAVLTACVSVPAPRLVAGIGERYQVAEDDSLCTEARAGQAPSLPALVPGPAPAGTFRLLNWNLYKGWKPGWEEDLRRLAGEADLLTLQEVLLPSGWLPGPRAAGRHWVLAPAFRYGGDMGGVLTASRAPPQGPCMLRVTEPLLRVPKSVLITRHRLAPEGPWLWVANVHGVNFTLGTESFRRQWDGIVQALRNVKGPLLVAGDFNTWSAERMAIVERAARRLGLAPVRFETDTRATVFGRPVDHVFYRGLTPVTAEVYEVTSSDHRPMAVRFRWPVRMPPVGR